ncbi:FecR family protein [Lunatibacter salilacus]|uniref:FecR family protein n=1 Tax=Lunatibacter salilacus TaxID=2483804 RepID=UPI00131DE223|nr:FecR family protein [Lunatibacter salilacus]
MEFEPKSVIDFFENEYFIYWLTSPDKDSDRYWMEWMANNPSKVEMLSNAQEMAKGFRLANEPEINQELSNKILNNILIHFQNKKNLITPRHQEPETTGQRSISDRPFWILVAACITLLVILFRPFWIEENYIEEENIEEITWQVKKTSPGIKSTFFLPDGTMVKLNSSSELSFPSAFSDTLRSVILSGQAYFEVQKDENAPFIVSTDNLEIKVLGTSFDVKSYPRIKQKNVVVLTGEVSVSNEEGNILHVLPSEMLLYNHGNKGLSKKKVDLERYTGWKDGVIIFKEQKYEEVFEILSEWYGVNISVEKGIAWQGTFSGRYENETLENILLGISYTKNFKFKINNKNINIYQTN